MHCTFLFDVINGMDNDNAALILSLVLGLGRVGKKDRPPTQPRNQNTENSNRGRVIMRMDCSLLNFVHVLEIS